MILSIYIAERKLAPVEAAFNAHLTVSSVMISPFSYISKNMSMASFEY